MRGGVSAGRGRTSSPRRSSPRAWGCFQNRPRKAGHGKVFPTCVGVFLRQICCSIRHQCLPHVRGGVSMSAWGEVSFDLSSPRAWGCFLLRDHNALRRRQSSPRAWGCFWQRSDACYSVRVFPTCVGVFLPRRAHHAHTFCLPHVRGGVSARSYSQTGRKTSSPRAWGCFYLGVPITHILFVFPTCVGVFPPGVIHKPGERRLPHVRGGVSDITFAVSIDVVSSPRAWGCFDHRG